MYCKVKNIICIFFTLTIKIHCNFEKKMMKVYLVDILYFLFCYDYTLRRNRQTRKTNKKKKIEIEI